MRHHLQAQTDLQVHCLELEFLLLEFLDWGAVHGCRGWFAVG
ncbi:hypothetical protein [Telluria aromaticivorans]|nr:hypothetical protein [Telluria aromaticivorans]